MAVHDDPRSHARSGRPRRQQRVVQFRRPPPDQNRIHAASQLMDATARGFAGDPLAAAGPGRELAVQRHGPLGENPRASAVNQLQVGGVQLPRFLLQQPPFHLDAGLLQFRDAASSHLGKRVLVRHHDPAHGGPDQGSGAGRRLAVMAARFERHVQRRAGGGGARGGEGFDFGVRTAEPRVPAFANDPLALGDHTADQRIRLDGALAAEGQFQGAGHTAAIPIDRGHGGVRTGFCTWN